MVGPQLTRDDLAQLVAVAGRAPSVHNTQPWRFRLVDPRRIELEANATRALPHNDPRGRELVISCGAALHNLLLAMRIRGLEGTVTVSPDADRPLVLASVGVNQGQSASEADRRAYAAVFRRHTHRQGFDGRIEAPLEKQLADLATLDGCELLWITEPHMGKNLISLAIEAAQRERSSSEAVREIGAWSDDGDRRRDGVPLWALAPMEPGHDRDDRLPSRFISQTRTADGSARPGSLAVLTTGGDGLHDWLAAGRALQRVLLRAAEDWAFAAIATPALEDPTLRDAARNVLGTAAYPQMILELGYSHITATTGRLDVDELIIPSA